jgi:Zn-dependent protease
MAGSPAFHLFGFPIHVRPGFLVFIALVILVNGGELGVWIAGSAAVFTLLHELGHGFAARATGANAEISLDFLAGYASFVPTRPLKRWERAGISVAGPAVQIGISVSVLLLMGVNPLERTSYAASEAALAIWWTGPIMGLLNLIPILPLDGGHIVLAGLDRLVGDSSKKVMLWFSIGLTSAMGLYLMVSPGLEGLAVFVLFPLMIQIQMLTASRPQRPNRGPNAAAAAGEAQECRDQFPGFFLHLQQIPVIVAADVAPARIQPRHGLAVGLECRKVQRENGRFQSCFRLRGFEGVRGRSRLYLQCILFGRSLGKPPRGHDL